MGQAWPWSLDPSPGLPWARSHFGSTGLGLDPGPGPAALSSGPGSRAMPGPCKCPVSYICACIFYANLHNFIPKDH